MTLISLLIIRYLLKTNNVKLAKKSLSVLIGFLFLFYLPATGKFLLASLENRYPGSTIQSAPETDVIVVLGGTVSGLIPPRIEIEESGDRLSAAARLFHKKKAPLVLVSGGVPYQDTFGKTRTESMDMKDYLMALLVPEKTIIEENQSRNTEENFLFSMSLLKSLQAKKILLVTSAFHMPRAMNWFSQSDLEVIPFPTDHQSTPSLKALDYVPTGDVLNRAYSSIKEYLGLLAFRVFNQFSLSK